MLITEPSFTYESYFMESMEQRGPGWYVFRNGHVPGMPLSGIPNLVEAGPLATEQEAKAIVAERRADEVARIARIRQRAEDEQAEKVRLAAEEVEKQKVVDLAEIER